MGLRGEMGRSSVESIIYFVVLGFGFSGPLALKSAKSFTDCKEIAFWVKAVARAGGRTGGRGKTGHGPPLQLTADAAT